MIYRYFRYGVILIVGFVLSCKKDEKQPSPTKINAFLSAASYDKLTVEVQSVSGNTLSAGTLSNLKAFLQQYLNKPNGIDVITSSIASPGKPVLSLEEIKAIETANRNVQHNGKNLTAYVLVVDADYAGNSGSSKVLGIAYSASSTVLFEKTIKSYSGGLAQPSVTTLETAVLNHEFGHLLGLVNNGAEMAAAHQDTPHGKHCNNANCLMYYTSETSDIVANLLGNNIPVLDQNCINDLKLNGGK